MNLLRSALSLLIHNRGSVTAKQIDDLLDFYASKKGIHVEGEKYEEAMAKAIAQYDAHENVLFVCTDSSCIKKTFLHPSENSLQELSEELNCFVQITGCHWQCDQAPVVTFKSGKNSTSFTRSSTMDDWRLIREYILRITQKRILKEVQKN